VECVGGNKFRQGFAEETRDKQTHIGKNVRLDGRITLKWISKRRVNEQKSLHRPGQALGVPGG
jgi:hypothetical protein